MSVMKEIAFIAHFSKVSTQALPVTTLYVLSVMYKLYMPRKWNPQEQQKTASIFHLLVSIVVLLLHFVVFTFITFRVMKF
uniref:Uncharacterized protein n=1 Tax=Anguilla anguilla TaxID=7936 RepID=A0A0E9WP89_ANGAN